MNDNSTLIVHSISREVRRVPANWQHPCRDNGSYIPLLDGYNYDIESWNEGNQQWEAGYVKYYGNPDDRVATEWIAKTEIHAGFSYTEWAGPCPKQKNYIPDWPDEERTHWQMYETVSEGTPVSPVMDSRDALARWLSDNRASLWGKIIASYEEWLEIIDAKTI
ncbi:hypothetical protein EL09_15460 [Salmonella enterica subsp. enterica]|nr:hypothetical protein [Salmonella enterica subsp. enterica]MIF51112.1 hypothetical protein [Salmonella enterica subsp. enterica]